MTTTQARGRPDRAVARCRRQVRDAGRGLPQGSQRPRRSACAAAQLRRARRRAAATTGALDQGREARAPPPRAPAAHGAPGRGARRARDPEAAGPLPPHLARSSTCRRKTIHRRVIRGIADAPYSNVTVQTDVPRAQFNYLRERPDYFPGVVVAKRYLRVYPQKELGAQLFGDAAEISPTAEGEALQGRPGRARASARRHRVVHTTIPARPGRLHAGRRRRARQPRRHAPGHADASPSRASGSS